MTFNVGDRVRLTKNLNTPYTVVVKFMDAQEIGRDVVVTRVHSPTLVELQIVGRGAFVTHAEFLEKVPKHDEASMTLYGEIVTKIEEWSKDDDPMLQQVVEELETVLTQWKVQNEGE